MSDAAARPAVPIESFPTLDALHEMHARLSEQRPADASPPPSFFDEVERFIRRGAATGAVLEELAQRRSTQSLLDYWASVMERSGRTPPDSTLAPFDPSLAPPLPDDCPYRGLDYFREEDRDLFFGRKAFVEELLLRLASERLLVVFGPSGSGKSSVVRAGLVPAIAGGGPPGGERCRVLPTIFPGTSPLAALRAAAGIGAETGERPSVALLRDAGATPILLVVDQFEELFTLSPRREADLFVEELLAIVGAPEAPHRVVLTMRSDFTEYLKRYPALDELFKKGRARVPVMEPSALREAIEKPAAGAGLRFEPGVVEELLQDLWGESATLPLLQFTLWRLWRECKEKRQSRVTKRMYEEVGGRSALCRFAEGVFGRMSPDSQGVAKRLFLRLALPVAVERESTRARVLRRDLRLSGASREKVDGVLRELVRARLLRQSPPPPPDDTPLDDATLLELAHESLVLNWPRLDEWLRGLEHVRHELRWLEDRTADWVRRGGRGRTSLLDDAEVREARHLLGNPNVADLGVGDDVWAFVAASQKTVERTKWVFRSAAILLAFALAVTLWALNESTTGAKSLTTLTQRLEQQKKETQEKLDAIYQEQARQALVRGDSDVALLYLNELYGRHADDATVKLLVANASSQGVLKLLSDRDHPTSQMTSVAWSADDRRILTSSTDKMARLWDPEQKDPLVRRLEGHSESVRTAAFGPNFILTGSDDETARAWKDDGTLLATLPRARPGGPVYAVAIGPKGNLCATSQDHGLRIWTWARENGSLAFRQRGAVAAGNGSLRSIAFSPDGALVATGGDDKKPRLWDLSRAKPALLPDLERHPRPLRSVAFDPVPIDPSSAKPRVRLLTASEDSTVRLWDVTDPKQASLILEFRAHQEDLLAARFSPDGRRIVTVSTDKTARIWDAENGAPLATLTGHSQWVRDAAFSHDGKRLATASYDGTARIWDLHAMRLPQVLGTLSELHSPRYRASLAQNGELLALSGDFRGFRMWKLDAAAAQPLPILRPPASASTRFVELSPDGRWAISPVRPTGSEIWVNGTALKPYAGVVVYPIPDGRDGRTVATLPHEGFVSGSFDPRARRAVTAGRDGRVRVWTIGTDQAPVVREGHRGPVLSAVFSEDGKRIVTGGEDGTARIRLASLSPTDTWMIVTKEPDWVRRLLGLVVPRDPLNVGDRVYAATFSHNGERVATVSADGRGRLWDAYDGRLLRKFEGHASDVRAVAFSRDDHWLATGGDDATVRLWDVEKGIELQQFTGHGGSVGTVAFADNTRLVSSSVDGTVRIWTINVNPPTPQEVRERVCCVVPFRLDAAAGRTVPKEIDPATCAATCSLTGEDARTPNGLEP